MQTDVFISYSSDDVTLANALCAHLEARHIRCWIAPRDVPPGAIWAESIIDAIEQTRVLVLVVSENANLSRQVLQEVERAVSKGIVIIPFRIEAVTLSKGLEYFLGSRHWLDAIDPPLERHLAILAGRVQQILDGSEPAPVSARPPGGRTPSGSPVRRRVIASGVAIAALVAAGLWWKNRDPAPAPESARAGAAPAHIENPDTPPVLPANLGTRLVSGMVWAGVLTNPGAGDEPCVLSLDRRTGDRLTFTAYFPLATGDDPYRWNATLTGSTVRGEGQGLGRQRVRFEARANATELAGTWTDDGGRSGSFALPAISSPPPADIVAGSSWRGSLESRTAAVAPMTVVVRVTSRNQERFDARVRLGDHRTESSLTGAVLADQVFGTMHGTLVRGTQRLDIHVALHAADGAVRGTWRSEDGERGTMILHKEL